MKGVVVDTSFFRGNYPEHCSIEACTLDELPTLEQLQGDSIQWKEILPQSSLAGDSQNAFPIESDERFTHLRLKIYPDGGVARLRVYGEVVPDWERLRRIGGDIDLAAVENGGVVLSCSDMFFGHRHNLIMPGRAANMSDGWETKRRRGPGYDWSIIKLGKPGQLHGSKSTPPGLKETSLIVVRSKQQPVTMQAAKICLTRSIGRACCLKQNYRRTLVTFSKKSCWMLGLSPI